MQIRRLPGPPEFAAGPGGGYTPSHFQEYPYLLRTPERIVVFSMENRKQVSEVYHSICVFDW
jgi:hypothetical protein